MFVKLDSRISRLCDCLEGVKWRNGMKTGSQSVWITLWIGAAPSVLGWKHEFNKVLLSVTLQVSFNGSISKDFILHRFFYEDPRWAQAIIYEYLSFTDLFKSACSSIFSGTSFAFACFFHVYILNLLVIIGNIK